MIISNGYLMKNVSFIEGSELDIKLEQLYKLRAEIIALKEEIKNKDPLKWRTIKPACESLQIPISTLYRACRLNV